MKLLPRSRLTKAALIAAAVAVLVAACSVFGGRGGTEQRDYEVLDTLRDRVEIRRYGAAVYAEAREPAEADSPRSNAFRMLFRYIQGANRAEQEIAMTAPVAVEDGMVLEETAPMRVDPENGDVAMRFYLPAGFTEATAPIPTEDGVSIGTEGGATVAVLRYTWSTGAEEVARRRAELLLLLDGSGWKPIGSGFAMFYDPPWTLPFLRRNEVAVAVEPG